MHAISAYNEIQVIDTPHVWGRPMTEEGVAATAGGSVRVARRLKQLAEEDDKLHDL